MLKLLIINTISVILPFIFTNDSYRNIKLQKKYLSFEKEPNNLNWSINRYLERRYFYQSKPRVKIFLYIGLLLLTFSLITAKSIVNIALILFIMISFPVFLLSWHLKFVEKSINSDLFGFLSRINSMLMQSQDILDTLLKVENKIDNPYIILGLRQFNLCIRAGLSPELAFEKLQEVTYHSFLKYFYLNVEQTYIRRGDVIELMKSIEHEYISVQIEMNKRNIELAHFRDKTILSVMLMFFTSFKILSSKDYILEFYIKSKFGNLVLFIIILGLGVGISFVLKAIRLGRE